MTTSSIDALIDAAQAFADAGDLEQVERTLCDGVRRHPDSTDLKAHLGYFYYRQKRYRRALYWLNQRRALEPPDKGVDALIKEIEPLIPKNEAVANKHQASRKAEWMQRRILRLSLPVIAWLEGVARDSRNGFSLHSFLKTISHRNERTFHACIAYHKSREIAFACENLPIKPGARLLDAGTGYNAMPLWWTQRGADAVTLDGSPYGFERLRQERDASANEGCFSCCLGDVTRLPFDNDSFDGVSALCMIEHIPYQGDAVAMREIFRVLKPGGLAAVTVEANRETFEEWLEMPFEIGYQIQEDRAERFEELFCRNYAPEAVRERLAHGAPWEIVSEVFYDDGAIAWRSWFNDPRGGILRAAMRPLQPLISLLCYRERGAKYALSPSSIACLLLKKPL
ncbi:MAG: methyltransferase domain-containing protein [bacterium]|nr:methyltransferase domain-containing protein [bacterium]